MEFVIAAMHRDKSSCSCCDVMLYVLFRKQLSLLCANLSVFKQEPARVLVKAVLQTGGYREAGV